MKKSLMMLSYLVVLSAPALASPLVLQEDPGPADHGNFLACVNTEAECKAR